MRIEVTLKTTLKQVRRVIREEIGSYEYAEMDKKLPKVLDLLTYCLETLAEDEDDPIKDDLQKAYDLVYGVYIDVHESEMDSEGDMP